MTDDSERMQILEMIDSGAISAEDGLRLLQALDGNTESEPEEEADPENEPSPEEYFEVPKMPPTAFVFPAAPVPTAVPVAPVPLETPVVPTSAGRSSGGSSTGDSYAEATGETFKPRGKTIPSEVERLKRWWMVPLWIGVAITVIGALLMFLAWQASQFSFWFACTWVPFLLGVGLMVLAFASSRMRWLHLQVYQKENEWPRKISISMPLPFRFIGWIMKMVSSRVPDLRERGVDQMVMALEQTNSEEPFYLEVGDDDDGKRVEIYIG
jgi:hypothetical protein